MSSGFQARFVHAAEEFERYRPAYPPELFERIVAAVPTGQRNCAMDLGAGTGKSTRTLLLHFREVIAVEPDPGMAAKLVQQVPGALVRNVTAEDCVQPDSSVDLVTVGNALHWMALTRVFANVRRWLPTAGFLPSTIALLLRLCPRLTTSFLLSFVGPGSLTVIPA